MTRLWPVFLVTTLLLLMVLIAFRPAYSHSFYDWQCCSNRDCAPLPDGAVHATADGWRIIRIGLTVPYTDKRIRDSPDGRFHACFRNGDPTQDLLCLYVPGMGS